MKKIIISFCLLVIITFVIFLSGIGSTLAAGTDVEIGTIKGPVEGDFLDFISRITKYIQPLIAVVFLFVIVYGGYTRMTATGDPEKEKKSMSIITAGIIGFLIIVLAPAIVNLITSLVGVQGGGV